MITRKIEKIKKDQIKEKCEKKKKTFWTSEYLPNYYILFE